MLENRKWSHSRRFLSLLLSTVFGLVWHIGIPIASAGTPAILTDGTPIALRLTETVSPETHHPGDIVHLEVAMDVTVGNVVVIKAGTPAEGEVVTAEKKGMLGEPAKIGITVRSTKAVDGQRVPLRATLTREGKSQQVLALVLSLLLCILFILMKGKSAEFPSGSEVKAYVENNVTVNVEKPPAS